jgi:LytS/YehU family sensor histidine kinase
MELTSTEESMIRNMMLSKSYKEIAFVLDFTYDQISAYVSSVTAGTDIITYQQRLDEKKSNGRRSESLTKTKAIKVAKEKVADKKIKEEREATNRHRVDHERNLENKRRESRQRLPTIQVDYTKKVMVRIDRTTFIYAFPGQEEQAKAAFLKQYRRPIDKI